MIFRQLFDAASSTFTYLLADEQTRDAVLIDPVFEQFTRDEALLRELQLRLRFTLETHVHADHVTSAWLFKERLHSQIAVSAKGGAKGVDLPLEEGSVVSFGAYALEVLATPGHTSGCVTYVTRDRAMAFTGDALLVRSVGRTDFQEGSAQTLFASVREKLFTLPEGCLVYPAHDYLGRTVTTIGEERAHNHRLALSRSRDDFESTMAHLGLPAPKQMAIAVPANLRCGQPDAPAKATWGAVSRSFAGIPTIDAEWLAEHAPEVTILDVREPAEFEGELGHLSAARLVPLGQLRAQLNTFSRERPVVTVCRSGARSGQAAVILEKAGFERVANLGGGMLRWVQLGFEVTGGRGDSDQL